MTRSQLLTRIIAGAGLLAIIAQVRFWLLWRRGSAPAAAVVRRCSAMIVEHPQSIGLLILAALSVPLPLAVMGWAAIRLATLPAGLYAFVPLAAVAAAVALMTAGAAAVGVGAFAAKRLRGERPSYTLLPGLLSRLIGGLAGWLGSQFGTAREPPLSLLSVAVMLVDDSVLPAAARRAAALISQLPQTAEALRPTQLRLAGAAYVVLGLVVPACHGFFFLPVLSFSGYKLEVIARSGFGGYAAALVAAAVIWTVGALFLSFRLAAAIVHAAAVYIHATAGTPNIRERVLARFTVESLWPQMPAQVAPALQAPAPADATVPPADATVSPGAAEAERPAVEAALPAAGAMPRPIDETAPPAASPQGLPSAAESTSLGLTPAVFGWPAVPDSTYAAERMPADAAPRTEWATAAAQSASAATAQKRRGSVFQSRAAKGLLRMGLLIGLGALVISVFNRLDGSDVLRRQYVRLYGQAVWGTVERMDAEPRFDALLYRLTFSYPTASGSHRRQALVGEGALGHLERGKNVLVRILAQEPEEVCLDDDFGYSAQRGALLLVLMSLLIVGGWSFVFRVI